MQVFGAQVQQLQTCPLVGSVHWRLCPEVWLSLPQRSPLWIFRESGSEHPRQMVTTLTLAPVVTLTFDILKPVIWHSDHFQFCLNIQLWHWHLAIPTAIRAFHFSFIYIELFDSLKVIYICKVKTLQIIEKPPTNSPQQSWAVYGNGRKEKLNFNRKRPTIEPGLWRTSHLLQTTGDEEKEKRRKESTGRQGRTTNYVREEYKPMTWSS